MMVTVDGNRGYVKEVRGMGGDGGGGRSVMKGDTTMTTIHGNNAAIIVGAATARQRSCPKLSLQPSAKKAPLLCDGRVAS
jgi:hypothetical protein